jgi:hypothetical protein
MGFWPEKKQSSSWSGGLRELWIGKEAYGREQRAEKRKEFIETVQGVYQVARTVHEVTSLFPSNPQVQPQIQPPIQPPVQPPIQSQIQPPIQHDPQLEANMKNEDASTDRSQVFRQFASPTGLQ